MVPKKSQFSPKGPNFALVKLVLERLYIAVADLTLTLNFRHLKLAAKDPNGGRRLRSQVCRDLDCIAAQIKLVAAEKAKKVADAVISISYILKKKCLLLEFMILICL